MQHLSGPDFESWSRQYLCMHLTLLFILPFEIVDKVVPRETWERTLVHVQN